MNANHHSIFWLRYLLLAGAACVPSAPAAEIEHLVARDTLAALDEVDADARECLAGFTWQPAEFSVAVESTPGESHDYLIRFASPIVSGNAANDLVAVRWYAPGANEQHVDSAPAVVVVHESGGNMAAGQMIARSFRAKGLHALMVELPYYGHRRGGGLPNEPDIVTVFRQGVADIRRTRDVAAVLPDVDSKNINLQGTSLGGLAAALAASLDGAFDHTFLVLAGGNLHDLVNTGQRDTAKFRQRLVDLGHTEEELRSLFYQIEPTRIVHRLDPASTWLYSARDDRVVPLRFANNLASAARLDEAHHQVYPGNHYSVFLYFPKVLDQMVTAIEESPR